MPDNTIKSPFCESNEPRDLLDAAFAVNAFLTDVAELMAGESAFFQVDRSAEGFSFILTALGKTIIAAHDGIDKKLGTR